MSDYLDALDAAADWRPEGGGGHGNDIGRAWSMGSCLTSMHRYHLRAYLGWKKAYTRGLCTERELGVYLARYALADKLGISWRAWLRAS